MNLRYRGDAWNVYVLCEEGAEEAGPSKIGTARDVKYRVDSMRSGNPRKLVVVHVASVPSRQAALAMERKVHGALAGRRLPGRDWFNAPASQLIALILSEVK